MIVNQISEGESYDHIKKTINIVVVDFCFIEGGDAKRYHHRYRLFDDVDKTFFGDVEEIHVIELPKLPADPDGTPAWGWTKFVSAESEEDLDMLAGQNEVIKDAVKELYRVSAKADVRRQYDLRERAIRDQMARDLYIRQQESRVRQEEARVKQEDVRVKQDAARVKQEEARVERSKDAYRAEGQAKGRAEERTELLSLLQSGKSLEEILEMYK
jgi:predicted transposase/invertase (TIGR01784 family)